ncbi:hypothetical protein Pmani_016223 [Petrolisthes manimaculis]|uniref:Rho-GAP domain-containing protein n=1 Tax=Petrolisthes manimaculis TaxID=1843537 RepID=A0AAE1PQ44_9EUCA|nr:hypothetical protein Pmani_016223 [Petrolisthes manimaculis]
MNLGRQLKRVKQQADQLFLRSDRTDAVGEQLRGVEERVDELRILSDSCKQALERSLHTHTIQDDKKLRKVPQYQTAEILKEGLNCLPVTNDHDNTLYRTVVGRVVEVEQALGIDLVEYEEEVEKRVVAPLSTLIKDDIPSVTKQKKQLKQDIYAYDIFTLLSKERQIAQYLVTFLELQRCHLVSALGRLETVLPDVHGIVDGSTLGPVFGAQLSEHLKRSRQDIAVVLRVCVCRLLQAGLYEEGLLRVAGSAGKIRRLKAAFDAGLVTPAALVAAEDQYDVHVVAGTLKCYLRELPEPLCTYVLHQQWLDAARIQDHQKKLQNIWTVLQQLPTHHHNNLRYLIKFLSELSSRSHANKMTYTNIAIVVAPNLIWGPEQLGASVDPDMTTLGRNMSLTADYRTLVECLVQYADYFFKEDVDFGQNITGGFSLPHPKPRHTAAGTAATAAGTAAGTTPAANGVSQPPPRPTAADSEVQPPLQPPRPTPAQRTTLTRPTKPALPEKPAIATKPPAATPAATTAATDSRQPTQPSEKAGRGFTETDVGVSEGTTSPPGPSSTFTSPPRPQFYLYQSTRPQFYLYQSTRPQFYLYQFTRPSSTFTSPPSPSSTFTSPPGPSSTFTSPPSPSSAFTSPLGTSSTFTSPPGTSSTFTSSPSTSSTFTSSPSTSSTFTSSPGTSSTFTSSPGTSSTFTSSPSTSSTFTSSPSTSSTFTSSPVPVLPLPVHPVQFYLTSPPSTSSTLPVHPVPVLPLPVHQYQYEYCTNTSSGSPASPPVPPKPVHGTSPVPVAPILVLGISPVPPVLVHGAPVPPTNQYQYLPQYQELPQYQYHPSNLSQFPQ